jgi:hypothetical protein
MQLASWLLIWADAVPYESTARLSDPGDIAVKLSTGVSTRLAAWFEASLRYGTENARAARHWEYIPDVRFFVVGARFYIFPDRG